MSKFACFMFALALAIVFAAADQSYALGRRRGGMMICNVAQNQPVQATAENLVQTAAARVYRPLEAKTAPVLVAKSRSGVDLHALQAMNARPASPVGQGDRQVASK